eukprot:NODE_797_length_1331_cov_402.773011_g456_i1.p1 GENE.NODE_797_length_1331_cov_402.773011_g456_i1~~NODE_797_length_1331_cov_402.773011_g456_i1.p1  ORF type:complete len:398 (-),score=66.21 NODE_797_length_1331_cov_402.773011_g456_i1:81-1274(-)
MLRISLLLLLCILFCSLVVDGKGGDKDDDDKDDGGRPGGDKDDDDKDDGGRPANVNCVWNSWGRWSGCSGCGSKKQYRTRSVRVQRQGAGRPCTGAAREEQQCNLPACAVNCRWGSWSGWSACRGCGTQTQTRTRTVAVQRVGTGAACTGSDTNNRSCQGPPCVTSVDCVYEPWSEWCSCTGCGADAKQLRRRGVESPASGGGEECVGPWVDYRPCPHPVPCEVTSVDCKWSPWSDWSDCTGCDVGTQTRTRFVEVQPVGNGEGCGSKNSQSRSCQGPPCPEDCVYEPWSEWCSCIGCGVDAKQMRRRGVESVATPGGKPCNGPWIDYRSCPWEVSCDSDYLKETSSNASAAPTHGSSVVLSGVAAALVAFVVVVVAAKIRTAKQETVEAADEQELL